MSSCFPDHRLIKWKCPKCGYEIITPPPRNPWIINAVPWSWLWGKDDPPTCDKCGTKMERSKLL